MLSVDSEVRVIGFVGSARVGGNTDIMVTRVLEEAAAQGAETVKVYLHTKSIKPCLGCDVCHKPPYCCVTRDDMSELRDLCRDAGAFVLGTPVYWWGPSGFLKNFVDRWYGMRGEYRGTFRGKRFGLVAPLGDDDPRTARHVVGMFQDAVSYLGSTLHEPILAPGCNDRGDVERVGAALNLGERYRKLGKFLAGK